jgi:hypothetical protein
VAHPQIATFARLANANDKPVRKIEGQKTLLGRTMHSIMYDEIHDEFTVPQPFAQAILTFRGGANGEEAPIRVIQGLKTQLIEPERLTTDPINNEILVPQPQSNSILVFPRTANGDVAPIRILKGPDTGLGGEALGVDAVHNLLIAAGAGSDGLRMRIFSRTAQGNVKPLRVIGGPKSKFARIGGPFAVYAPKGWIIATVRGPGQIASDQAFMGIWSVEDNGDVPPRWTIGGPNGVFKMPRGVAIDEKNKSIIASDKRLNAVLTFYFPEAF